MIVFFKYIFSGISYIGLFLFIICFFFAFIFFLRKTVLFFKFKKDFRQEESQKERLDTNVKHLGSYDVESEPEQCMLCSVTFDRPSELLIELKKDGYGDCKFCPRYGRRLV